MSAEKQRGCGFRKIGGTYITAPPGISFFCKLLPKEATVCPCCSEGIKQSLSMKWFSPKLMFPEAQSCTCPLPICPLKEERSLISWVGQTFYPTPESFIKEAQELGISKRIGAIPKDLILGSTWVFLAHPKGAFRDNHSVPGIFYAFKPQRIERIVTESDYKDEPKMKQLRDHGIHPVPVPDNDPDHRGSVYEKKKPHVDSNQAKLPVVET